MQKVGAKEQVLDQIKRLQTQVNDEVKNLRRLEHKLSLLGEPEKTVWDARTNLTDCVKAWNSSLGAWCKEIEKLSGGLVKVSIDEYGDTKEIHRALTQLSSGTGSHESVRHREFDAKVSENGVDEILKLLIQEAILLLKWSTFSFDTKPQPEQDYPTLSHILGEADSIRSAVLDQITLEAVSSLLVATARPLIDFKYKSGTQTISFEKASEGQRAAVLLMMLLRQQGGPLIIDQPESDLDNNIIAEVANQLHSAKENRQIVVVTHNANLIVNGAAELVNLLETDPTGIRRVGKTGVIDSAEIKVVITNTMEGGEKAFKGRKAKYGF
jgi:type III restriction enzyme